MKYAVLSDIHGNLGALEAVLTDAARRGARHVLNLGDSVYGPLDPEGTARRLMRLDTPSTTIRGNEDRVLFEPDADPARHGSLIHTLACLSEEAMTWLGRLPPAAELGSMFLVHGIPDDDEAYLLEEVDAIGARARPPEEVGGLLRGRTPHGMEMVLCGHSHVCRSVQVPDGPLVVNPGSVGLPAYSDDSPFAHSMRAGSPHARYAIVEDTEAGWNIVSIALAYDWESAARTAEKNGRSDWAAALRTGWTPSLTEGGP